VLPKRRKKLIASMKQTLKDDKGIALFLVLWVLTLLMVIVGEFCYTMKTEINITRNFKENTEGYYIAMAGLNRTIAELIKSAYSPPKIDLYSAEEDEEEEIEWRANAAIPPIIFKGGEYKIEIENESGKINLNRASRDLLKMMLNSFDLDEEDKDSIADSILDWRDQDNLHRLNGAEDDYYLSLSEPYECKDGDFDTIEELLLVKGIIPEIFYGGLDGMITIYSDLEKININSASKKMLLSLPRMTDTSAQEIIDHRKEKKFESITELIDIIDPDTYTALSHYITLKTSPYYTVKSFGSMEGSKINRGIKALIRIDTTTKKGYRFVEWIDLAEDHLVF